MKIELKGQYEIFEFDKESLTQEAFRDLKNEIKRLNLDINIHAIGLPDANDLGGYCIHYENGVWLVYLSEKGSRKRVAIFVSPYSAVNYFLWCHIATHNGNNTDVGKLPKLNA